MDAAEDDNEGEWKEDGKFQAKLQQEEIKAREWISARRSFASNAVVRRETYCCVN